MFDSILTKYQVKSYRCKLSKSEELVVQVRWDDSCGNGHNSLGVTADLYDNRVLRERGLVSCGCLHDDILSAVRRGLIPQKVGDLIPFHLCSSDGPLHYLANVRYLAGDRGYSGKRKGEPCGWDVFAVVGNSPIKHKLDSRLKKCIEKLQAMGPKQEAFIVDVAHEDRPGETYKFAPRWAILIGDETPPRWHECPFDLYDEANQWMEACLGGMVKMERIATSWSEGKERELKAARSSACGDWPEDHPLYLSDAQLCDDENLPAILEARLPLVIAEMKKRIEAVGLVW